MDLQAFLVCSPAPTDSIMGPHEHRGLWISWEILWEQLSKIKFL